MYSAFSRFGTIVLIGQSPLPHPYRVKSRGWREITRKIFQPQELQVKYCMQTTYGRTFLPFWACSADGVNQAVYRVPPFYPLSTGDYPLIFKDRWPLRLPSRQFCGPSPPSSGRGDTESRVASVTPFSPESSYESTCTISMSTSWWTIWYPPSRQKQARRMGHPAEEKKYLLLTSHFIGPAPEVMVSSLQGRGAAGLRLRASGVQPGRSKNNAA